MKKKNWLLTIAFAVMSLAIVSTCVIGSTYARFTSNINAGGNAQAAGFKVVNETVTAATVTLLAPGQTASVNSGISYFSQVKTEVVVAAAQGQTDQVEGYGIFEDWTALVDGFTTWKTTKNVTGDAPANLAAMFTVTVQDGGNGTLAEQIAGKIRAALNSTEGTSHVTTTETGIYVDAMGATATAAVSVPFTTVVTWVSTSDAWDTYCGEKIAERLANTEIQGDRTSGVTLGLGITVRQYVAA